MNEESVKQTFETWAHTQKETELLEGTWPWVVAARAWKASLESIIANGTGSRKHFENMAKTKWKNLDRHPIGSNYIDTRVECAWIGWQEALARATNHQPEKAEPAPSKESDYCNKCGATLTNDERHYYGDECESCLPRIGKT